MLKLPGLIDTSGWLTPKKVMHILNYKSVDAVTDKCVSGEFRYLRRGGAKNSSYLIDPESVAEWQAQRIAGGKKSESSPAPSWPAGVERLV